MVIIPIGDIEDEVRILRDENESLKKKLRQVRIIITVYVIISLATTYITYLLAH